MTLLLPLVVAGGSADSALLWFHVTAPPERLHTRPRGVRMSLTDSQWQSRCSLWKLLVTSSCWRDPKSCNHGDNVKTRSEPELLLLLWLEISLSSSVSRGLHRAFSRPVWSLFPPVAPSSPASPLWGGGACREGSDAHCLMFPGVTHAAKGYFDALVRMGEMASESQGSKDLGESS